MHLQFALKTMLTCYVTQPGKIVRLKVKVICLLAEHKSTQAMQTQNTSHIKQHCFYTASFKQRKKLNLFLNNLLPRSSIKGFM